MVLRDVLAGMLVSALVVPAIAGPASAQTTVEVVQAECLPIGDNGLITSQVRNEPGGSTVRVYFRRLHEEVEDFYYVQAYPVGSGNYQAVLPKAEDEVLEERDLRQVASDQDDENSWAEWWREKEGSTDRDPNEDLNDDVIRERASLGKQVPRTWMKAMTPQALQDWLETLENEPTEYYSQVLDATGQVIATSSMKVVEVRDDCKVELTERQRGIAENLVVGETATWEEGERVFHWLCDGIVTRIDPAGVLRADNLCRVCFVAWWEKKEILLPLAAGIAVGTGIVIAEDDDDQPISPSGP